MDMKKYWRLTLKRRVAVLAVCLLFAAVSLYTGAPAPAARAAALTPNTLLEGAFALGRAAHSRMAAIKRDAPAPATTPVIQITDGALEVRYYSESTAKFKLRVAAKGATKFTNYDFTANNTVQRFGLPSGASAVTVQICEHIGGTKYRIAHEATLSVTGASDTQPAATQAPQAGAATQTPQQSSGGANSQYLASVSDINWAVAVLSVDKARELCNSKADSSGKAEAVYNFLVTRLSYDFSKLGKLSSSYLPVMDDTYSTQMGICYDIASLYAGMLRSAGIPTKLCMGYTSMVEGYHAWNEVEIGGKWHTVDITTDCQLYGYGKKVSFSRPQGTFNVTKSH